MSDWKPAHELGDEVYLRTDPEQLRRMVTGLSVRPIGILYLLTSGAGNETVHYEIEISKEKTTSEQRAGFRK